MKESKEKRAEQTMKSDRKRRKYYGMERTKVKRTQQITNRIIRGRGNMTKADAIRQMSDEDLAYIMICPMGIDKDSCIPDSNCIECCLEWLKQEAEE